LLDAWTLAYARICGTDTKLVAQFALEHILKLSPSHALAVHRERAMERCLITGEFVWLALQVFGRNKALLMFNKSK